MTHQEESADSEEKQTADDAEPVSIRDIEMMFAPGKPPPMLKREPVATSNTEGPSHREAPKPPRPPRHAAAPRDMGGNDLAAFAALGSIPAPALPAEKLHQAQAAGESTTERARPDSTPVPESKRIKARVLPRLRKPLPVPFAEPHQHEDWKPPTPAVLEDLKSLTSSYPPPPPPTHGHGLDFDDILGIRNDALGGALSAPIMPPDLARLLSEPSVAPSARPGSSPAKRGNGAEVASAVTGRPNDPKKKKKKKGAGASSAPESGSVAPGPRSERRTSAGTRPSTAAPAKEASSSRTPIYVLLAAALLGGGYLVLRDPSTPSTPNEVAKREPPKETPAATTDLRPAQAPLPAVTATPTPPTSERTAEAAPSAAPTALSGKRPTASTSEAPTATTPTETPSATPKPTATPAATGGDFDKSAASAALGGAVGQATGCKQSGDPSGVARVQVTFAPSGRVTVANISGPPFAGTATGGCIARAFKTASVPPFSGDPVTVSKTVQIP